MKRLPLGRGVFLVLIALIYAFIIGPIVIVLVAAVSTTPYLTFPPAGFTLRWFRDIVLLREFTDALWTSLEVATAATLLALVLGTWIALALRRRFPGRDALQAFFLAPIVLPELALGIGLLQFFSRTGYVRGALALVLAHSLICTPYAIRTIMATDASRDRALEESALSLGAAPWRVLWDVILPSLRPGLICGGIMAFVISFDNVSISMFLAAPGSTTLPALLFDQASESGLNTTLAAVCALLIVFMLVIMVLVERVVGLEHFFASVSAGARQERAA
jgi:putative spermidine/putrescine transport system permease protein